MLEDIEKGDELGRTVVRLITGIGSLAVPFTQEFPEGFDRLDESIGGLGSVTLR